MELSIFSYFILLLALLLFSLVSWFYNSRGRMVLEFCVIFSVGLLFNIVILTYVPFEEMIITLLISAVSGLSMLSFAIRYKSGIQGPVNRIKASSMRIAERGDLKNINQVGMHEEGEMIVLLRSYRDSISKFSQILEENKRLERKITTSSANFSDKVVALNEEINEVTNYINKILQTSSVVSEQIENTRNETDELISRVEAQFDLMREAARTSDRITDQTNLIAVNAAIEAANTDSASGTNFSTVADGIQQLASRSRENTDKLQSLIYELNRSMIGDLEKFKNTLEEFENSIIEIGENSNYASSNSYAQLNQTENLTAYAQDLASITKDLKTLLNHFIIDE